VSAASTAELTAWLRPGENLRIVDHAFDEQHRGGTVGNVTLYEAPRAVARKVCRTNTHRFNLAGEAATDDVRPFVHISDRFFHPSQPDGSCFQAHGKRQGFSSSDEDSAAEGLALHTTVWIANRNGQRRYELSCSEAWRDCPGFFVQFPPSALRTVFKCSDVSDCYSFGLGPRWQVRVYGVRTAKRVELIESPSLGH